MSTIVEVGGTENENIGVGVSSPEVDVTVHSAQEVANVEILVDEFAAQRAIDAADRAEEVLENIELAIAHKTDRGGFAGTSQDLKNEIDLKLNISDYNEHFKGKFTSLVNLQTAIPVAEDGDYAIVDVGAGVSAKEYIWDLEEGWVISGSVGPSTTDALAEGSTNLYFTSARVLAVTLSGLSALVGGPVLPSDTILVAFGKIKKDILDIFTAISNIFQPDVLVSSVPPTRVGNTFTYPANQYQALISKTIRTNPLKLETTIDVAATDYKRIDLIWFKSDNTLQKTAGTESLTVAQRPDIPIGSVGVPVSFINVFGNVVADPTPITKEISIQDSIGVEKFKITDYIRFKGVGFNAATKQIEVDPLLAFNIFIDTVSGNDLTAEIQNKNKPFKTHLAAYNAIPVLDGSWTLNYLNAVTIDVTTRITGYKIYSAVAVIIDISNTVTEQDNKGIDINIPRGTLLINGAAKYVGMRDTGNFYIIARTIDIRIVGIGTNGIFCGLRASTDVSSSIKCDILTTTVTPRLLSANCVVQIGILRGAGMTYSNNNLNSNINNDLTINTIELSSSFTLFATTAPKKLILRAVTGTGTLTLGATGSSFTFFLDNLTLASTAFIIPFSGGSAGFVSGTYLSDNYNFGGGTLLDGNMKFIGFSGKYNPPAQMYDTTIGVPASDSVLVQDSNIIVLNHFINIRTAFQNERGLASFTIRGSSSIYSENNYSDMIIQHGGLYPLTVQNYGNFKTNFKTYGKYVTEDVKAFTFKEKKQEVIIRDKKDLMFKTLSSSITYIIDGIITLLTGEYIEVPAGGLTIIGYGFDVSQISKNVVGQSIFTSPAGGSGNFVSKDLSYNPGLGTVFNVTDSNGTHAIEINDVNFNGVSGSALGVFTGYRQFTGTTCGLYYLSDGITLEGNWSGFKLTNSNIIGFGASGTLFKKGAATVFSNRFYIDLNLQVATGSKICDFAPANFTNDKSLQVVNCYNKVNGVIDATTTSTTFPNITETSSKANFVNNIGIKNSNITPYGISTTNLLTYADDAAANAGGVVQVGETYIESSTGYYKKRLT